MHFLIAAFVAAAIPFASAVTTVTVTIPACGLCDANNCLGAVRATDCSSYLAVTITPSTTYDILIVSLGNQTHLF